MHVWHDLRNRNVTRFPWAPADFHDLRTQATMFNEVAALTTGRQVIVAEGGQGRPRRSHRATRPPTSSGCSAPAIVQGSDFTDADGTPPPAAGRDGAGAGAGAERCLRHRRAAILSHEFWQRQFGANPAIVGTVVALGQQRIEVVGVLEPGFEMLFPPGRQHRACAGRLDADARRLCGGFARQRRVSASSAGSAMA